MNNNLDISRQRIISFIETLTGPDPGYSVRGGVDQFWGVLASNVGTFQ